MAFKPYEGADFDALEQAVSALQFKFAKKEDLS